MTSHRPETPGHPIKVVSNRTGLLRRAHSVSGVTELVGEVVDPLGQAVPGR